MMAKFEGVKTIGNLEKKLTSKNRGVFKSIRNYIGNSNLVRSDKNEVLQDVIDMIIQGQEDGRDIEYIVGKDHQKFCEDILEEYKNHNGMLHSIIMGIQQHIVSAIVFTVLFCLGEFLFGGEYRLTISINNFLLANIFALAIIDVRKNSRKESFIIGLKYRTINLFRFNSRNNSCVSFFIGVIVYFVIKYIFKYVFETDVLNTQLDSNIILIAGTMVLIGLICEFVKKVLQIIK